MFLSAPCSFALRLIMIEFETAVELIAVSNTIALEEVISKTCFVIIVPEVSANWILSPTFNSVLNFVEKPVTACEEADIEIVPDNCTFSAYAEDKSACAV